MLRRVFRVWTVFYAQLAERRAEMVLWVLASTMSFIMMGVWYGAASRGALTLAPDAMVRYFTAAYLVDEATTVALSWKLEGDILSGQFGHFLMAPIDPLWRYFIGHFADLAIRLPASSVICVCVFAIFPPAVFVVDTETIVLVPAFCVLAFLLRFALQYTIALLSFWTERASAVESLCVTAVLFLSGALVPLGELSPGLQQALSYTPFPIMIWVPARLLVGGGGVDVGRSAVVGVLWLVALVALNRVVWRRARRRFAAIGG